MLKTTAILCMTLALTYSLPARNDGLDKVSENDVAANDVNPSISKLEDIAIVHTSGSHITEYPTPPPFLEHDLPKPPIHHESGFPKLIQDIFRIPITILESVATLVSNFGKH